MKFFFQVAAGLLAAISVQAFAEGDAAAGQAKSAICAACHGADGNSVMPQWPKLAGPPPADIVRPVNLIKSGARPVPEMVGIVAAISDQDIEDIAAWFSSQNRSGGVADPALVAAGEKLFRAGNAKTGVPACMACHGPAGEGNPLAGYPALAGQHSLYMDTLLKRFRSGENWGEKDTNSQVMDGVAAALRDQEIAEVTSFIQGLYRAGE
jgi:cytochrome c553